MNWFENCRCVLDLAASTASPARTEADGFDVVFHFAQNIIELSLSDISFHLLSPFVIIPTMQPRLEFGALLKRELFKAFLISAKLISAS